MLTSTSRRPGGYLLISRGLPSCCQVGELECDKSRASLKCRPEGTPGVAEWRIFSHLQLQVLQAWPSALQQRGCQQGSRFIVEGKNPQRWRPAHSPEDLLSTSNSRLPGCARRSPFSSCKAGACTSNMSPD